jgi:hypothetical protein
VAFGRCRKNRGGTPTGERARSGGSAQADLFVARTAPAGADHETLRLSAFRFLLFVPSCFVIASASEAIQCSGSVLDCFVASLLAMTIGIVGCLTKLARIRVARTI